MEFLFELWIHRGLLGPYYAYMVEFFNPSTLGGSFRSILCKQF